MVREQNLHHSHLKQSILAKEIRGGQHNLVSDTMYTLTQIVCFFWLSLLSAHALAAARLQDTTTGHLAPRIITAPAQPRFHHLLARDGQSAGSSCSDEGQWNCMTNSWQRCAAGRWSVTMACAKGTTCYPAGLTHDFKIQHDGSVNGNGGAPTTSVASSSAGERRWGQGTAVMGLGLVVWMMA